MRTRRAGLLVRPSRRCATSLDCELKVHLPALAPLTNSTFVIAKLSAPKLLPLCIMTQMKSMPVAQKLAGTEVPETSTNFVNRTERVM